MNVLEKACAMQSSIENGTFGAKENTYHGLRFDMFWRWWSRGLWCGFLRSLDWISWDSSENAALWGQFSQLAGYISWYLCFLCLSTPSSIAAYTAGIAGIFWAYFWYPCSFRDLHGDKVDLLICNHPPPLRRWESWGQGYQRTWWEHVSAHTHIQRKRHTQSKQTSFCKHIPSVHLNITPVFTPKNNIFTLSHSFWGLIRWIESDNTDLQKSGAPPFTNVR